MGWRVGADIGGTFTDVVVVNDDTGDVDIAKVSTTPQALADGVLAALDAAIDEHNIDAASVSLLSHATTVVTNAILEEKGARVAMITTKGFRDVLELRRSARPDLYDLFQDAPAVLVQRRHRFEVNERIDATGEIVVPLDKTELSHLAHEIAERNIEAIAVCLLFSFLNDRHEQAIGNFLTETFPTIPIYLSCEVLPEIREFERSSTTAICAYVAPILSSYLQTLAATVTSRGLPTPYVMGSSGGLLEITEALKVPAAIVESGPAAGVIAAAVVGKRIDRPNLISFDMGGTTAKASLILNGQVETTPEYEVGGDGNLNRTLQGTGHPIRVPVVDLAEVSAGGGSIAWVDPAGSLRVGPRSAGAEPGPVCYGRGGEEPTVTDANLLLGRLDSHSLLAGRLPVDFASAQRAVDGKVGEPLNLSTTAAAAGIIDIVNNAMAEALRTVSVERGHDPRDFSLIAFGGAGPLHAVALAEELEIGEVIIPTAPGAFSALGLVGTDVKRDYARTWFNPLDTARPQDIESVYAQMESVADAMLERAGIPHADRLLTRSADLRYRQQAYELNIVAPNGLLTDTGLDQLACDFHAKHLLTYGHCNRSESIQMVTLRVHAVGKLAALSLSHQQVAGDSLKATRPVWFKQHGELACPVYERSRLALGVRIEGPAIVESLDATLVLPPDWHLTVATAGFVFLRRS